MVASPAERVALPSDGGAWQPKNVGVVPGMSTRPLTDLVERISVGVATGLNRCFIVNAKEAADLEDRHCVRAWGKPWYALHDPVTFDLPGNRRSSSPIWPTRRALHSIPAKCCRCTAPIAYSSVRTPSSMASS